MTPIERMTGGLRDLWQQHDLVSAWTRAMAEELKAQPFQRDPEFIARTMLPLMRLFRSYFDGEMRGLERLPKSGPMMMVGNHSGGTLTPDTTVLISSFYDARGVDSPLVLLGLDAIFAIPGFKEMIRRLGLVPANESNADRALDDGAALLVYPGGAYEAFRPYAERNRIELRGRKGFIRMALRKGVPVVPVVGHGGHETTMVLSRGERMAETMGMKRMRLDIFPVVLQVPWGVSTAATPGFPLPAKITLEACEPLDWTRHGPDAANDPVVLEQCYEEITTVMQDTLTRLARERPHPLADGLRRFVPGGW